MAKDLAAIASAVAWPIVALIVLVAFKDELRGLVNRVRRGGGVEFDPPPTQPLQQDPPPLLGTRRAAAFEGVRTPATVEAQQNVLQFLAEQQIQDTQERVEALSLMAARALLVAQFERIDAAIWASQLNLLHYLNTKPEGETPEVLRESFYRPAADAFPAWFANYQFENYLGFLLSHRAVAAIGPLIRLTDVGREYLLWRVQDRRPPRLGG